MRLGSAQPGGSIWAQDVDVTFLQALLQDDSVSVPSGVPPGFMLSVEVASDDVSPALPS